jgi:hypothetical protein
MAAMGMERYDDLEDAMNDIIARVSVIQAILIEHEIATDRLLEDMVAMVRAEMDQNHAAWREEEEKENPS